ncbi:methionine aminopeptidase 2, putative [Plasmodium chabaudi adami]|uniref:Methionine aminopeptidase 2 n=1 Tax=Plasmodium chabaudi adami TaxID=5826 RepID=A0A1D3LKB9_PLACE|nr:methionine aminopeptidase 2, putative [Plasmodium chabaudi adami]
MNKRDGKNKSGNQKEKGGKSEGSKISNKTPENEKTVKENEKKEDNLVEEMKIGNEVNGSEKNDCTKNENKENKTQDNKNNNDTKKKNNKKGNNNNGGNKSGNANNQGNEKGGKKSKGKKKGDKLDSILDEFKKEIGEIKIKKCEEKKEEKVEEIKYKIDFDLDEIKKIKKSIVIKEHLVEEQDNKHIRLLKNWPQVENSIQTSPATIPIEMVYKNNNYPVGEILNYNNYVLSGQSLQEKKELEKLSIDYYQDLRKAAECHRQVRKYIQTYIKPGRKMIDIVQKTEQKTKELILSHKLKCGWGFPTGCSLNNCAAHYTPNYGDETVLKEDDVCKLDFGVHVNGYIIDCAFTIAFNDKYDNLIKATQDGTNTGIKEAGIDARMCDIGEAIQEAIESYEIELNQKVYPIKPISNLRGHSICKYVIHGGKCVPIVKQQEKHEIMEEGDLFAIETFASTGKGYVVHENDCSHYMRNRDVQYAPIRLNSAKTLLKVINEKFDTLPFCNRWLDDLGQTRHFMSLKTLIDLNIVEPYPPLCDIKNSFTSQMEHTILLRPTCKEVLSRGPDF